MIFSFNHALETSFVDVDQRTRMSGKIYALIDTLSLFLQLGTGLVVKTLGLGSLLIAIPLLISIPVTASTFIANFLTHATAKVTSKTLDYSLFRASKELLYLPLNYAAKTRAKAFIDMFGYRFAKGGASLVLLFVLADANSKERAYVILSGLALWIWLSILLKREHQNALS
ncbi:MAG: hypothetical protein IPJ88_10455 [Myxococcales bacterium]|nr:MAG: hypothetical protein IPJ88_10455 [Myxococcales bacterium]